MQYIEDAIAAMTNKTVVFWGAGRRLSGFLKDYCIDRKLLPLPDFICDSTRDIAEQDISGIPVLDFDKVKQMKAADTIIVMTAGLLDLQAQVVRNELYYFPIYFCRSFETYFYLKENDDAYRETLELLEDEHSKHVYRSCLEGLLKGSLWNQSIYEPSPYFGNDVVGKLEDNAHLVFAGAFNGKHIDRMLLNNSNIAVDACEPSRRWHEFLTEKFAAYPRINIHNTILWDKKESLKFQDDASNSGLDAHVCARDSNPDSQFSYSVESIEIDSLVKENPVSLIALDVEGSEQRALKGAKNTILRDKPKLTICLYHSMDDFIRIPLLINEMSGGGYKFYVKQHSCISAIETVLYAV